MHFLGRWEWFHLYSTWGGGEGTICIPSVVAVGSFQQNCICWGFEECSKCIPCSVVAKIQSVFRMGQWGGFHRYSTWGCAVGSNSSPSGRGLGRVASVFHLLGRLGLFQLYSICWVGGENSNCKPSGSVGVFHLHSRKAVVRVASLFHLVGQSRVNSICIPSGVWGGFHVYSI